jgi:hypothetical protein
MYAHGAAAGEAAAAAAALKRDATGASTNTYSATARVQRIYINVKKSHAIADFSGCAPSEISLDTPWPRSRLRRHLLPLLLRLKSDALHGLCSQNQVKTTCRSSVHRRKWMLGNAKRF